MNVLVVSDTHGNQRTLREIMNRQSLFDCLIHLGDGVRDGMDVARELNIPFHGICGNEDFGVPFPDTLRLVIGSWTFFLMHGHQMDISAYQSSQIWDGHLAAMAALARKEDAMVFLFGHTHRYLFAEIEDTVIINPGDQYIGSSMPPSFAAIELLPNTMKIRIMRQEQNGDWCASICRKICHPGNHAAAAGTTT
jgi:putative phosphoesterase